jgi:hypothetical protein
MVDIERCVQNFSVEFVGTKFKVPFVVVDQLEPVVVLHQKVVFCIPELLFKKFGGALSP